ncbi:MAG: hypothetical protein ABIQ11_05675, partial [Saprospiraceae bacterium]
MISALILLSGSTTAQCPVTTCDPAHQTFVDLSTVPECGSGGVDLTGDLQMNQDDCQNGTLNCHEFIMFRSFESNTQEFTLKVGQGIGCTGELDGSFASINGVCSTLSNGGSGTFITYTFPQEADTIYVFFCLNSGAQISICDLCTEPPPVDLIVDCPPEDGGTFTCIDEVPPPDPDILSIEDTTGVVITVEDEITGTGCGTDTQFVVRTYYISDDSGVDSCIQVFKVLDDRNPALMNCPASITVSCDSQVPAASISGISASDNCDQEVTITFAAEEMTNFTCADGYTLIRTYQATDDCGNSSTCTQTITVDDNTPPVFSFVPPNMTISCDDTPAFGTATASDNCGSSVSVTFTTSTDVMANCAGGTSTRVFTATDVCGNSSTSSQTLTFVDTQPPVFTFVPTDTIIACDATPVFGTPTATDNCDSAVVISFTTSMEPNSNCAGGTSTRVFTATDNCGNSSTASQTFTFIDTDEPVFVFVPADTTVDCSSVPEFGMATAIDDCDTSVVITFSTSSDPSSNCAGGATIRTFTATDNCGNTSTADQVISFVDSEAPSITCPSGLSVSCANLVPLADVNLVEASDNCDDAPTVTFVGDVTTNQTCADRYTLTRTYRATDACGNSATCSQIITVFDNTAPIITCPANVTVECASLVPAPNTGAVITSDNCGGSATVTFVGDVTTNQTCADRYTLTRTYRATDVCGNSATCSQIITVFDNTAPIITCPSNVTVQCANQVPAVNTGAVNTTNNCGGSAIVTFVGDVITNQTCADRYTLTRTYRATDACGNPSTCSQIITVFDNTAPIITCPSNVTVQCGNQVPAVNTGAVNTTNN